MTFRGYDRHISPAGDEKWREIFSPVEIWRYSSVSASRDAQQWSGAGGEGVSLLLASQGGGYQDAVWLHQGEYLWMPSPWAGGCWWPTACFQLTGSSP